jgi:hypothetical protein
MFNIYAGIREQVNHAYVSNRSHLASNSSADLASKMMSMSTLGLLVARQEEALRGQVPIPAEVS